MTIEQARTEGTEISRKLYSSKKYPLSLGQYKDGLRPIWLKEYVSGALERSLKVLWAAVGMILLIVCVNLANLMLARAATRTKEFALRISLGAGRGRLIRQLITESLVLSAAGSALGLALAYGATTWLAHQGSIALPLLSSVGCGRNGAGLDCRDRGCGGTGAWTGAGMEDDRNEFAGVIERLRTGNELWAQA